MPLFESKILNKKEVNTILTVGYTVSIVSFSGLSKAEKNWNMIAESCINQECAMCGLGTMYVLRNTENVHLIEGSIIACKVGFSSLENSNLIDNTHWLLWTTNMLQLSHYLGHSDCEERVEKRDRIVGRRGEEWIKIICERNPRSRK